MLRENGTRQETPLPERNLEEILDDLEKAGLSKRDAEKIRDNPEDEELLDQLEKKGVGFFEEKFNKNAWNNFSERLTLLALNYET